MSLPQRRKALYRVEHSGDAPRWFHHSQKNDAVVLRSLRQAKPNNDIEWEQQRYRLPEDLARLNSELSGAKEFPLPSGLSIEHPNKWLEYLNLWIPRLTPFLSPKVAMSPRWIRRLEQRKQIGSPKHGGGG